MLALIGEIWPGLAGEATSVYLGGGDTAPPEDGAGPVLNADMSWAVMAWTRLAPPCSAASVVTWQAHLAGSGVSPRSLPCQSSVTGSPVWCRWSN